MFFEGVFDQMEGMKYIPDGALLPSLSGRGQLT